MGLIEKKGVGVVMMEKGATSTDETEVEHHVATESV